ncbi:MAG TPA: glycerol-3-phosphate dehydrogenase/oxidase [Candidatus Limnocylindrales bacterium]|nr:glycerol-3-phosphate dehydrogenase/oxidase [Candidatus Limnocylindrales bacterium]
MTGSLEPRVPGVASALERRAGDLARLAGDRWDLVVVGGGIVGCGAALDAASRGMRVALLEQDDIAAGTSSRSSRLIHGGLRYLEQYQFRVVHESLAERARLLRLAPHLVRLETFMFPLYGPPLATRLWYGTGMTLYDLLGSARSGGFHRHLGRRGALEWAPRLRRDGLRGALAYHDAMEDDARLALAVLRTAIAHGALAVTRVRATGAIHENGRIAGVHACETGTGATLDVRADAVLDATGVWASQPDRPFGDGSVRILPSRGSHILVPRSRIEARGALTLRVPGKVAFFVPWPRHWIIGTTDAPYHGPVDRPVAGGDEVDVLLGTVNRGMDVDLQRDEIVGTYAGLRPLVAPSDASSTVKVSRGHKVSVEPDGLVRITGGKYTTYRVMAAQAVDAVLGSSARGRSSATADLPIVGSPADAWATIDEARDATGALARRLAADGLDGDTAEHLVGRYGTEAETVVGHGRDEGLLRPLVTGFPHLEAEIAWAVVQEFALSLDDVLSRRLRLAMELPDRGAAIAARAAEIAGSRLGWDAARREAEVARYLEVARREYDVPPPEGGEAGRSRPVPAEPA